jgi:RNA 3'-terminal phosphate cyclase (ATP)
MSEATDQELEAEVRCCLAYESNPPISSLLTGFSSTGLKAQHVASIDWLVRATNAEAIGLEVGSTTLELKPRLRPSQTLLLSDDRRVRIAADTAAASAMLILQAVLPFLLFTGGDAIELELCGGTNVAWSPSWDYVDQVLLPALEEHFNINHIERRLISRGWNSGREQDRGTVWLRIQPLALGQPLRARERAAPYQKEDFTLKSVDVTLLAPAELHSQFQQVLARDIDELFPDVDVRFPVVEDTGSDSRIFVLLVGRSTSLRWGRDNLFSIPKKWKAKERAKVADIVSKKVCMELYRELELGGTVDEYLQDQLVVFQALAEGETSFPRDENGAADSLEKAMNALNIDDRRHRDKMHEPFGEGSLHTTTARWVTAELLPKVVWYNKGRVCQGVGVHMEEGASTS